MSDVSDRPTLDRRGAENDWTVETFSSQTLFRCTTVLQLSFRRKRQQPAADFNPVQYRNTRNAREKHTTCALSPFMLKGEYKVQSVFNSIRSPLYLSTKIPALVLRPLCALAARRARDDTSAAFGRHATSSPIIRSNVGRSLTPPTTEVRVQQMCLFLRSVRTTSMRKF